MGMPGAGFGGRGGGGGGGRHHWEMRELAKQEHFDWNIVRRASAAFFPYWRKALVVSILLLATSAGGTLPAWLTQRIIDEGILKGKVSVVMELTASLIGIALVTGLLGVAQTWLSNSVAQDVMADYRLTLFKHIQRQTVSFFASRQAGDLVSRVMNDVTAIQNVITSTMMGFASNVLAIVTTLALMFEMNWKMTVLSLIVVPGFVLPTQRVGGIRQTLQGQIQQKLSALTVQLSEQFGVSGAMLTRIFSRETDEIAKFSEVNQDLRNLQVRQTLVGRWLFMWIGMFSSIGPALLWAYGGWLAIHHQMGLGTIVAFTALLGRLYSPLSQLAQLQVNLLSSIALFRRIFAVLDVEPEVQDGPITIPDGSVEGRIRVEHVSFAYRKREDNTPIEILKDIQLDIAPGQMVALVGPSGAGKTTLLNLIPRFSDPHSGRIVIDDYDSKSLTLSSLRGQMGLVPQDPFFFHDTIYNNLLFAKPVATRDEIEQACRAAQIHDMIASLPEAYDTVVGERGYRLSGGERQRLAIARVLLRAPRIVLLDEATSALDTLVERQIQEALAVLMQGRTAIVIAHRLSTVLTADKIVVLNHGRIVAEGKHHALLETSDLYKELYEAQFAVQGG
ncbi:ABC transporter ATP-binding protein [Alicyclobacillus acidiphilus]|uniref:ABC transporter ATP-binding protein n=1 Tax=Alicyclobacillus acidiphilus TaxID=182455 RepID=UPI00082BB1DE|nr:ABC transporter ATP-binding protein [Alicyclobacillus acidiphilus]